MIGKQLKHFTLFCLKQFFDLDPTLCIHAFLFVPIVVLFFKLFRQEIAGIWNAGVATVREDAQIIRSVWGGFKERLGKGELWQAIGIMAK